MERQVQEEEEDMLGTYCILSDTLSSDDDENTKF